MDSKNTIDELELLIRSKRTIIYVVSQEKTELSQLWSKCVPKLILIGML